MIGFAAQRTIGNFIAGLLIAFTQPLRLGDEVEIGDERGVVEEIGLTYTWLRTRDNDQLVIPNEKLVSETLRNSTIRSPRDAGRGDGARAADRRPARAPRGARATTRPRRTSPTSPPTRRSPCAPGWPTSGSPTASRATCGSTVHDRLRELGIVGAPDASSRDDLDCRRAAHLHAAAQPRSERDRNRRRAAASCSRVARSLVLVARRERGVGAGAAFSGAATSRRCARSRSARTRSSTRPTAACSARSRPRGTASRCRSARMSPWLPKATIAIEDRRFYQHGGVDYEGIVRALWKDVSAGRVVEGGSTIAQQLVRQPLHRPRAHARAQAQGGVPRDQAQPPLVEEADPARVPQHRLLRQPRLRRRGGAQTYFSKPRARADAARRRRCSPACRRRRRSTTRSTTRRPRSRGATRCCARCSTTGAITRRQYRGAAQQRMTLEAGPHLHENPAAVLLLVRDRGAPARLRHEHGARGRAPRLHDDRSAAASGRRRRRSRRRSTTATTRPPRSSRSSPAPGGSAR